MIKVYNLFETNKRMAKEAETRAQQHEIQMSLYKEYAKTRDPKVFNKIIQSLNPLIESKVRVYAAAPIPRDALYAEAVKLTKQALDSFNPSKGVKISTHVNNYLQKLYRFTANYQNVGRIPEHRISKISVLKEAMDRLSDELGREPTVEELSDDLGWPISEVERLKRELAKDLLVPDITPTEGFSLSSILDVSPQTSYISYFYAQQLTPEEKRLFEKLVGYGTVAQSLASIAREEAKRKRTNEHDEYARLYKIKQRIEKKLDEFLNG